jgi:DNA-binding MarR family transcriptional regulator
MFHRPTSALCRPPVMIDPHRVEGRDVAQVLAGAMQTGVGLLLRRLQQLSQESDLTLPEISALARLHTDGPSAVSDLARLEHIRPQSMGATLAALRRRGLVEPRPDPRDRRRFVISITEAGATKLQASRGEKAELIASALERHFTEWELRQLLIAAPLLTRLSQKI